MGREGPKIVQIDTQYVQTDVVNFRDVVQSLTGKNSSTDWIGRKAVATSSSVTTIVDDAAPVAVAASNNETNKILLPSSSILINNFKDFDGFVLPPNVEMMPWSYS